MYLNILFFLLILILLLIIANIIVLCKNNIFIGGMERNTNKVNSLEREKIVQIYSMPDDQIIKKILLSLSIEDLGKLITCKREKTSTNELDNKILQLAKEILTSNKEEVSPPTCTEVLAYNTEKEANPNIESLLPTTTTEEVSTSITTKEVSTPITTEEANSDIEEYIIYKNIIFCKQSKFDLEKFNTINNIPIYHIIINGSKYFFNVEIKYKYIIILLNDNKYYILKVNESSIDLTIRDIIDIYNILTQGVNIFKIRQNLRISYNILYFNYSGFQVFLILDNAKEKLLELNKKLIKKCGDVLSLELDYVYNMHPPNNIMHTFGMVVPKSLVLCLNHSDGCISSITISIKDDKISIDSETAEKFQFKKYNKLLRCIVIIISKLISPEATELVSSAINPISAYLMINTFNGFISQSGEENDMFFTFLKTKNIDDIYSLKENMISIFKQYAEANNNTFMLTIQVDLTHENIELAEYNKFDTILTELLCN
jgi:hypothetical protein